MFAQYDNSYARLPGFFFSKTPPTPVPAPSLIAFNNGLAEELGFSIEGYSEQELANIYSGNTLLPGMEPIAVAYAGHQFGGFVPRLGDGRAHLLCEVIDQNGNRRDVQLKGSGKTPFSRGGDGRAALGPVIREYIISEAMHALGIKTTRSLAAVTTGEPVFRETALPGAMVTRVAQSHLRIGTFEFAAAHGTAEEVRILADYTIQRLYPHLTGAEHPYIELIAAVMEAQAALVASWMQVGFIHGVMNTDNMALSGETIDYGPCAFMDSYDPATVFSSIDTYGRYAYGNQPKIAQWNLARFAETLLPLLSPDMNEAVGIAEGLVAEFRNMYYRHWSDGMLRKIGVEEQQPGDETLVDDLLTLMQQHHADYTLTFRLLSSTLENSERLPSFFQHEDVHAWLEKWRHRLDKEKFSLVDIQANMQKANPIYIPRNAHVEAAITAAVEQLDFSKMKQLQAALSAPYTEQSGAETYAFPGETDSGYRTYCGT